MIKLKRKNVQQWHEDLLYVDNNKIIIKIIITTTKIILIIIIQTLEIIFYKNKVKLCI